MWVCILPFLSYTSYRGCRSRGAIQKVVMPVKELEQFPLLCSVRGMWTVRLFGLLYLLCLLKTSGSVVTISLRLSENCSSPVALLFWTAPTLSPSVQPYRSVYPFRGRNLARVTSSVTSSKTTSTGIPMVMSSFATSTRLVSRRGPSSNSTSATEYGMSCLNDEK